MLASRYGLLASLRRPFLFGYGPVLMNDEAQRPVDLLHPFYLDTDMSMAFAAALTGGVALQREEVERDDQASETARNVHGSLRIFDLIGVGAGRDARASEATGSESRMIRHHTEASLFITLHDELQRTNQIKALDIDAVRAGDMISVSTGPAIAPLRRVVDQVIRLLDLTLPLMGDEGITSEEVADTADMTRQQRREQARRLAKEAVNHSDNELGELRKMQSLFVALQDDLDRSGMVDVVVRREEEPAVVLTLDKRFVEDQTLELLHTSRFKVIGKVTQIWPTGDDVVNLYRRSVMSLIPALGQVATWGTFTLLASMAGALDVRQMEDAAREAAGVEGSSWPGEEDEDASTEVEEPRLGDDIVALQPAVTGPAVQVLPLAICA
jgi:hypothetical protein